MQERVGSQEVARAMDEVIQLAGLRIPNRLHRIVAECTGLHPTTVLRYHRLELESADIRVLECIQEIGTRVQNGENVFDDEGTDALDDDHGGGSVGFNVSVHELNRWFERLRSRLGCKSTGLLYQYVEDETSIPVMTVMRYHSGELRGAPSLILQTLKLLERRLAGGEAVVFRRGPGETGKCVPRDCLGSLIDEIEELSLVTGKGDIRSLVSLRVGLHKHELAGMLEDDQWPFVPAEVYENVRKMRDMAVYDPRRHYEVGDRIWFPDLGTGTVVEKLPKYRMVVDFDKGVQRLLREDIPMDPRQQLSMA